jgi:hypothetical protein
MGFYQYAVLGIGITIMILLVAIASGLEGSLNHIMSQLDGCRNALDDIRKRV